MRAGIYVVGLIAFILITGLGCTKVQNKEEGLDAIGVIYYDTLLILDPVTGKEVIHIVKNQKDDFENNEAEK